MIFISKPPNILSTKTNKCWGVHGFQKNLIGMRLICCQQFEYEQLACEQLASDLLACEDIANLIELLIYSANG
jgi:hypothetical protein